ncbi:hypothetical protein BKA67DRAFT_559096 [Truncatella angustata]|uniref:Sacsin/Nov domain-containing protein n=1 Tax=Truncatella angustata TaxID=152316 RepID=A0A9P8UMV0_9PEZI|nr:uncharacterized protein BKA67DRAFT_559096 [Truncatella angustata]KAH6654965.1 hypothetical protein BKA67DRAFT_559096 [Truncatella angustata]KAH8204061.1 hypothetical protein TruAng_001743 [Truncatella angustata]
MDYGKLRAAALNHGEDEEAVTVDTRALIDKVLARYSGEWTTLRELIQNAADAQATTVKIKWETLPSTQVPLPSTPNRSDILKHVLQHHTLRRLVVSNNGQPFAKTDWARLKRIAEGNPDETKIGAFGVGFYSVFADCEEPFISSGSEAMAFYWKGNALFTRKLQLGDEQKSNDTAFVLDYRNATTTLPNLLSVGQFLATSLTFVSLQHVEFWIDDYQILSLHKKTSPSAEVTLHRDIETTTKDRIMKIQKVDKASVQIDASYMSAMGWKPQIAAKANESYGMGNAEVPSLRSFFSRLTANTASTKAKKAAKEEKAVQEAIAEDITATTNSSIFLRVTTANIKTSVTASFSAELERATKKPPPKMTKLAILTSSYDEVKASESSTQSTSLSKAIDVFASVLPSKTTKKTNGRIFIGFPTTQTTGAGMHISAPSVIPTVEREAIDLNARWVRNWNIEMLRAAGIMTRLAFANEMSELQQKLQRAAESPGAKVSPEVIAKHLPEAMHILNSFAFGESTPSAQVSQIIEEAFWTSYKKAHIEIYSTRGVRLTTQVRLGSEEHMKFVPGIPVIPLELRDNEFVNKLTYYDLLSEITVDDVRQELSEYPMNKYQLSAFLQWACKRAAQGDLSAADKDRLLDAAIATLDENGAGQGGIITLGSIKHFIIPNKIPSGLPIPPSTIPYEFTKSINNNDLRSLGWESLEIVPWLRFLLETRSSRSDREDFTKTPEFAVQVLTVLSKGWDGLSPSSRETVVALLKAHTSMPTKLGMRKPTDSFFPSVKLFDDLPTISQQCAGLKDKFLAALGVRKTVALDIIFQRLLNPSSEGQAKWSHVDLIKYLASVRADIPNDDLKMLREQRICPAEAGPAGQEFTKASTQLYKVSELLEPNAALRPLGVKILHWPGLYRASSAEGKFLSALGLKAFPSAPELVELMSSADKELRVHAMQYFVSNHVSNRYGTFDIASCGKSFLPLEGKSGHLVSPGGCYTNEASSVLGFNILKKDLHEHAPKFGVKRDPPIQDCVSRLLRSIPQDSQAAITVFNYFATRVNELDTTIDIKLRDAPIVPVLRRRLPTAVSEKSTKSIVTHISPRNCYLGSSSTYGDIFDFVDFGQQANSFLFRLGAKNEPTKLEIAQMAAGEPARLLTIFQSTEKYLNLLRSLAEDVSTLKRDKDLWRKLKTSKFLLAFKEAPSAKGEAAELDEDDVPSRQYQLASPDQVVILDDYISYRLFKEGLLCAPEEDGLETFYAALGSQSLGSLVTDDLKVGGYSESQDGAIWLRKHVVERSKIFIHEYSKHARDPIKHDARWLEKNLVVEVVRSLALRRTLRGHSQSHTEKKSAAAAITSRGLVLYVASDRPRPDMYQVGYAICQHILHRPSQQAYTFFEPFLKLDLLDLRSRGYNVDRILRVKAAEARMAEEEKRVALEAEQARMRDQERDRAQAHQSQQQTEPGPSSPSTPRARPKMPVMPGSFDSPESPTAPAPAPDLPQWGRNLFSNIQKRLGLEENNDANQVPTNETKQLKGKEAKGTIKQDGMSNVNDNLLKAVNSTRGYGSSTLFSPPTTQDVKEQATYCDETPRQNLHLAAEASNGMPVFVMRDLNMDVQQFLTQNHENINTFGSLIRHVGDVYSVKAKALHIFYDDSGTTIAFNSDGSIFCNLRYFNQLHAADMADGQKKAEAAIWWWVVLAHELAHNIEKVHNAQHSFYTESFVQQYFPKMMLKAGELSAMTRSLPAPSNQPPPYSKH